MGNTAGAPRQKSRSAKSTSVTTRAKVLPSDKDNKSSINGLNIDQIDDEELSALKQVCLSYIDMIEFVIDSIPEKKEDAIEPDFEPIFLQLKTFVTSAKRQLGRQEIDNHHKEERTLRLNATEIAALPDLPMEEPPTPSMRALNASSPDLRLMDPANGRYHPMSASTGSLFSDLALSPSHAAHAPHQSSMSLAFRKITGRNVVDDSSAISLKNERERIKTEIKIMKKQLKTRKFELLANNVWYNYLLLYLCRSEQFILSSTCKYCQSKCGIASFAFSEQFEFDNIYWRNNFFNFSDPDQECTLLIAGNKFELLSNTQKCQLKYYIKFWHKFIVQRERRKQLKRQSSIQQLQNNNNSHCDEEKEERKVEFAAEITNESKKEALEQKEEKNEEAQGHILDEEDDEEDLYGADNDNFEYDDDRPRGLQILEKYRQDFSFSTHLSRVAQDAALHIAIPCDVEQLVIRDCKNKNGELAHWLYSILCYVPSYCPIDWIGLENNNFQDRDIHRICAGLLNRKKPSNLCGLSLCNNSNITDKAIQVLLKTISKKCQKLQFLRLSGCTKLTNRTCQTILDFYAKTYNDDTIQLNYIDLSQNYKINDKGIHILNQIYLHQQYTPYNVVVRFYVAGTTWKDAMDDWSKNIILKPPKRR